MKSRYAQIALILSLVLVSGCTVPTEDIVETAKGSPAIQDFLSNNPNTETRVKYFKKDVVENDPDFLAQCQGVEASDYYKVEFTDETSGLRAFAFIDREIGLVCAFSEGAEVCVEDWSCTEWSPEACPPTSAQTRACTDLNSCGTTENRPTESRECTISACPDGTPYGFCSATKPGYCRDGNIIDKCSACGCDSGYECANESCQAIQEDECSTYMDCDDGDDMTFESCGRFGNEPMTCAYHLRTCANAGGTICSEDEVCSVEFATSSDSERCCRGTCLVINDSESLDEILAKADGIASISYIIHLSTIWGPEEREGMLKYFIKGDKYKVLVYKDEYGVFVPDEMKTEDGIYGLERWESNAWISTTHGNYGRYGSFIYDIYNIIDRVRNATDVENLGEEIIDGKNCLKVRFTSEPNATFNVWVWKEMGIPIKWDSSSTWVYNDTLSLNFTNSLVLDEIDFSELPDSKFVPFPMKDRWDVTDEYPSYSDLEHCGDGVCDRNVTIGTEDESLCPFDCATDGADREYKNVKVGDEIRAGNTALIKIMDILELEDSGRVLYWHIKTLPRGGSLEVKGNFVKQNYRLGHMGMGGELIIFPTNLTASRISADSADITISSSYSKE